MSDQTQKSHQERTDSAERFLAQLEPDDRAAHFKQLSRSEQFEVFRRLDAAHQGELLARIDEALGLLLVEDLDPDDRVRLFEQIGPEAAEKFTAGLSPADQEATSQLLRHPPESAGRIMTPSFLALLQGLTVKQALERIRIEGRDVETVLSLPVVDRSDHYLGMVSLDQLVLAEPNQKVESLMDDSIEAVRESEDQESVARQLQDRDVLAVPVVNEMGCLLGIVTVDDAMDIMQLEETEDISRAGAAEPLGRPYLSVSLFQLIRSRAMWLLLLSVAAVLTVNVLGAFEGLLAQIVSLSLFIPLLIGVGGNSGAQSATTIVRALAVGDIQLSNFTRIALREAGAGFLLGLSLAIVAFPVVTIFFSPELAIIVSLSLVSICTLASMVGSMMPVLAERLGVDPAVVSAPLVTTIVDACGLLVYFLIAQAVFGF